MADEDKTTPNLEDITVKESADITEEERNFLIENKENLSDEEAKKFDIEKEPEKPTEPEARFKEAAKKKEEELVGGQVGLEDELDLADRKTIREESGKVVEERLAPLEERLKNAQDITEVESFIRQNPTYAKYRDSMLNHWKHPAYRNIPVGNIAAIVAHKDLQKLGAEKEREAQKKAAETQGGGSTARQPSGQGKDWGKASKEDFAAKQAEVLGRQGG